MKKQKGVRRQIFVFTPEEKRAVACVLAAIALGLMTKQYRATHPRPPPAPAAKEQRAAKIAARSAAARARSARGRAATAAPPALPSPTSGDEIEEE